MPTLFPLPENHTQRFQLHNEVHARSSVSFKLPVTASHLAITLSPEGKKQDFVHLVSLCERFGITPPKQDADHFAASFSDFQLLWEQHNEFATYTFFAPYSSDKPFAEPALKKAPVDWLAKLPGKLMVAAHAEIIPNTQMNNLDDIASLFSGNALIGAEVSGGAACVYTDFRIHADGFGRFLIIDKHLKQAQAGRLIQRLFEIEVYRVMALLAFPIARRLAPFLSQADRHLHAITAAMAEEDSDDSRLLDELTKLAAEVENHISSNDYRFGAANAYYHLVISRIQDLREVRIQGLQTFSEFMNRRLEPAISTCQSTIKRFMRLSERISNAGELLRTRVDVSIERQNQDLLKSMNAHAKMQLKLQSTVEGLSIIAITSYVVGLIGSITQAMKSAGWQINPPVAVGVSIPIVLTVVALGVRHIHKVIQKMDDD